MADDPTLKIDLDAKAMDRSHAVDEWSREEPPTSPGPFAAVDFALLDSEPELPAARVDWILPADFVPVLRVPRAELAWKRLTPLASRILMRVDGALATNELLARMADPIEDVVRELRDLVQRGLVGFRA
jgi:hypothetical protein